MNKLNIIFQLINNFSQIPFRVVRLFGQRSARRLNLASKYEKIISYFLANKYYSLNREFYRYISISVFVKSKFEQNKILFVISMFSIYFAVDIRYIEVFVFTFIYVFNLR